MKNSVLNDVYTLFIASRKAEAVLFFSVSILLALVSAPIPYIFGYLIDNVIPLHNQRLLIIIMMVMSALLLTRVFLEYINGKHTLSLNKSIAEALSKKILDGIFSLPQEQRLKRHTGDLISRLTRDIDELYLILPHGIANFIYSILVSVIMFAILVYLSWQLSLMLLLLIPLVVIVYRVFNSRLWQYAVSDAEASSKKMQLLQEVIDADYEIKSYGANRTFKQLALSGIKSHMNERYSRLLLNEKVSASINLFPVVATVLIWYFASLQAIKGDITIGLIVTYTATISFIVPALLSVVTDIAEFPNQVTVLQRMKALMEYKNDSDSIANNPIPLDKHAITSLSVNNITFQYSNNTQTTKPLYNNLSMRFKKGKRYLIKAPNGFGKSTLFGLITGQLHPQQGEIHIDDQSIHSILAPHQYITLVPQNINIISHSIRDNLSFGSPDISDESILKMLEKVAMSDWLSEQEKGLDTILESHKQLSGGQIQRIGLARAFLRHSPILLLDEPTNNLDNSAIQYLIQYLQTISKNTICLIISHDDRLFPHIDEVVDLSTITLKEKIV